MNQSTRNAAETRARILGAAEALFMDRGFAATSLRMITAQAKVNLAAVNYHFGSKESLIREVFDRRLAPLNRARIQYLDRLESAVGNRTLTVERILEAIVMPALDMSRDALSGGALSLRLLGRAYSEPADSMRDFLPSHYREVAVRFKDAFTRALPQVPEEELVWRMHFLFGAVAYAMVGNDALQLVPSSKIETAQDAENIINRLLPFLSSAMGAPLPVLKEAEEVHMPPPRPHDGMSDRRAA
jgi:AcrR family transcriptional regulator